MRQSKRGEAKDFVKHANLEVGGRLPTNTHGGQLSEAYIHGMYGVNEGVRLIRPDVEHREARELGKRPRERPARAERLEQRDRSARELGGGTSVPQVPGDA